MVINRVSISGLPEINYKIKVQLKKILKKLSSTILRNFEKVKRNPEFIFSQEEINNNF